jgi:hypothetical protein
MIHRKLATSGIEDDVKIWAPTGPPRPPGRAAQRRMQINAQRQGTEGAHPVLTQVLLNDPQLTRARLDRMAARAARPGAGGDEDVDVEWFMGGDEGEEEDGDEEEGEGLHQPECSVQ